MLGFPGEDSIMARAIDAHTDGFDVPGFGEHRHGCPCHDMTEEEYDEDNGESCECEEIIRQDAEDARVHAMMDRMERDW